MVFLTSHQNDEVDTTLSEFIKITRKNSLYLLNTNEIILLHVFVLVIFCEFLAHKLNLKSSEVTISN